MFVDADACIADDIDQLVLQSLLGLGAVCVCVRVCLLCVREERVILFLCERGSREREDAEQRGREREGRESYTHKRPEHGINDRNATGNHGQLQLVFILKMLQESFQGHVGILLCVEGVRV